MEFPSRHEAERALDALEELQHENVLEIEDAVIVVKTSSGEVKLHQRRQVSIGEGIVAGGVIGVLVGLLFGFPLVAPFAGMALGLAVGLFLDSGIDDGRLRELGATLEPGRAALCVQAAEADRAALRERMHAGVAPDDAAT